MHTKTETIPEIKHYKEIHSFYVFIAIIAFAIVVLQPISMLTVMLVQTLLQ